MVVKGKIALAAVSLVGGVGVFAYKLIQDIDHAMNFKSNQLSVEHHSPYIYLKTEASEQESNVVTHMKNGVKVLENIIEDKHPSTSWLPFWVPLDTSSANPWRLLQKAKSENPYDRQLAISSLANIHGWHDADYQVVAQACDQHTLIGLARSPDVDSRFFLPPPPVKENQVNLFERFRHLLASLPKSGLDACTEYFTKTALLGDNAAQADDQSGALCFGGNSLSFVSSLSRVPTERAERFYLMALVNHSEIESHAEDIISNGGLQMLMELQQVRPHSLQLHCYIAQVLGNLAVYTRFHQNIIQAGFVRVLVNWVKSTHIPLQMEASRALANLDQVYTKNVLKNGIYQLHPQYRYSDEIVADVVFVHGLLGGAFHSWRQRANDKGESPSSPDKDSADENDIVKNLTPCWPKTWLAEDCPHLRILTVAYETQVSEWTSTCPYGQEKRSLAARSQELLKKLEEAGIGQRPVIWVTHSMGGLLVKQMLITAWQSKSQRTVASETAGVVFYSTPHQGSAIAAYSQQASYLLYPSVEVAELRQNSPSLRQLHGQFRAFVQTFGLPVLSFGEMQPTEVALLKLFVVPMSSAHPGFGDFHMLNTNHFGVCKPTSRSSPVYQVLLKYLNRHAPSSLHAIIAEILTQEPMDWHLDSLEPPPFAGFDQ
ncbi:protein SERAC1-like [Anneissia japonica]|uniref:protein SERAC1-like n=1 Tax=Anneissia japonica TaxID=1529436 RepID=UPI0014256D0B|nr:protein SERAC1-like [Anneissia japonica]